MISSSRDDKDIHPKKEGDINDGKVKLSRTASSSRQWSAFRNPRIVRVSRTFGGKDRHSKVITVKGLRDRRIRLSIQAATQLYDLQEKLGLNQPSKVIDWLLDATKNDIENLPPLQVSQGFGQFLSPMLYSHEPNQPQPSVSPFFEGFNPLGQDNNDVMTRSKFWDVESSFRLKSKEIVTVGEKGKWTKTLGEENEGEMVNYGSQKLFPLSHCHSSVAAGLLSSQAPFNSFYHLDASNMSLTQLANHGILPHQESLGSQLVFYQQPSFFPSYPPFSISATDNDNRETSHFVTSNHSLNDSQSFRFSSFPLRPFSLSMNACQEMDHDTLHRDDDGDHS